MVFRGVFLELSMGWEQGGCEACELLLQRGLLRYGDFRRAGDMCVQEGDYILMKKLVIW